MKIVQKDERGEDYNPWVDAFQDEWIAILTAKARARKKIAVMANGVDADDIIDD